MARSRATKVKRSVRLNTFRPGGRSPDVVPNLYLPLQLPGYSKEVFAKSFSANRDHAHLSSLHRVTATRRGTGLKSGIIRRPPANHVPRHTIPAVGYFPDPKSGWQR